MKKYLNQFSESFAQAFISCCTMMVQGDFLALTAKHAYVASKTAGLTGAASAVLIACIGRIPNPIVLAWAVGILTIVADLLVHPSHFGNALSEAAATGAMTAVLSYATSRIMR